MPDLCLGPVAAAFDFRLEGRSAGRAGTLVQ